MPPFSEQLLAVTFAPSDRFLARGSLALRTEQPDSQVKSTRSIPVLGNTDGLPQPVADGYDAGQLDGAVVGFEGSVLPYPPALLFAGQPLLPGPVELSVPGGAVVDIEPLRYPASAVGGLPASSVFLVQIPPRARLSVELSGLQDNADLGLFLLADDDTVSTEPGEALTSTNAGTSPEVVQFRNAATVARRALIVVGRVDGREVTGVDDPADTASYSLLAQLNVGPEFADVDPVLPLRGAFAGGTAVTVRGVAFEPGALVRFGSHEANRGQTVVSDDGMTITTVTPAADDGDAGVPVVIVVQNPSGAAATHPPAFVYDAPAPLIRIVDPPSANENGGVPVTIRGAYFSDDGGTPRVRFGDIEATDVQFVSSTELSLQAPAHPAGLVNVTVSNVDAEGAETTSIAVPFLYTESVGEPPVIDAITPDTGINLGGELVTIAGAGFTPTTTVRFGGTAAADVDIVDANTLVCRTPVRLQAGVVDVLVLNADGRFALAPEAFTYEARAPELINPSTTVVALLGGTRVAVDGANFFSGLSAAFHQTDRVVAADVIVVSSTRLVITSPPGLAAGDATLMVQNSDGQMSNALAITVVAPVDAAPRILALSPASVRTDTLVPVRVAGTGFSPGLQFFVDDDLVVASDVTSTSFSFTPPVHAVGPAFVRVVNEDGQTATAALNYEPPLSPVLFSVTPDLVGAFIPGDVLTVAGVNLGGLAASVEDGAGVIYATTTTAATTTSIILRLEDPLPEGSDYRVVLDGFPDVQSPTFSAIAPTVNAASVVAGQPFDGTAFSLLLQGTNLNKDRISAVRFSLAVEGGDDVVVDRSPTLRTTTAVRVDLAAPGLSQGSWMVALVYDFTTSDGPQTLVVEAPGALRISGNCGNGVLEDGEECDGASLGGLGCADVGFFGGTLRCSAQCVFDTRRCDRCGDGIVDVDLGEQCDGDNLNGTTCTELIAGSTSGTPACDQRCQYTAGSCATCGNGICEGGEECDGTDFQDQTCATLGYNAGTISCDERCALSGELCSTCGDNRCDALENTSNCPRDCAASCGNGTCDADERCTTCPRDCGGQCESPYSLRILDGDAQSGLTSSALTVPLVVEARADGNGAPLVGVRVTFAAPDGGDVNPVETLTDATGRALTLATLPRRAGSVTFTATGTGPDAQLLSGAPLSFAATATVPSPGTIVTLANRPTQRGRTSLSSGRVAATAASLDLNSSTQFAGVAVRASDGTIFLSDTNNHRVVAIDTAGTMTTVVGPETGEAGFVDNVPAAQARLSRPLGLAVDAGGNLLIADSHNNRVRRWDATTGLVTTVAGGGTSTTEGVLATTFNTGTISSVAVRTSGELFLLTPGGLRRVDVEGKITTPVPSGIYCSPGNIQVYSVGESQVALDRLGRPIFFGSVYDGGCGLPSYAPLLFRLENDGKLSHVAGGGPYVETGSARSAELRLPMGLATDAAGNFYVGEYADGARTVRKLSAFGVISTLAGQSGVAATPGTTGDGGPATSARLGRPSFLAFTPGGDLLIVDGGLHGLRQVSSVAEAVPPPAIVEVQGGGQVATVLQPTANPISVTVRGGGVGLSGVRVNVTAPAGAAAEPSTGLTDANGTFSALAFLGRMPGPQSFQITLTGFDGQPLPVDGQTLGAPIVVTMTANDVVDGAITTVLNTRGLDGGQLSGSSARTLSRFRNAGNGGVAVDPDDGTLYMADTNNHRVLRISPAGEVAVVAGTGSSGNGGNGPALTIALSSPRGVALDADKRLYIADTDNDVVRMLDNAGNLTVFAGGPINQADPADGVVATGAALDGPTYLVIGPAAVDGTAIPEVTGDLFIVEDTRNRIRRVDIVTPGLPGTISSSVVVAGSYCYANNVQLYEMYGGISFDRSGRLYLVGYVYDGGGCPMPSYEHAVFRREHDGRLTVIAGGTNDGASGPAYGTRLRTPAGLAIDRVGNLYVAERDGHRIRRIDALGGMTTVVGDGVGGFNNDNVPAVDAQISSPLGLAMRGDDLYFIDGGNNRLRMVRSFGRSTPTTATMAVVDGDGQTATMGQLAALPLRVRVVDDGNLPVVNLPITFTAEDPGDAVTQPLVATTVLGEASSTVRVGRSTTTPHRIVASASTWLDPTPIRASNGDDVAFVLTAARPVSGSSVAIVNSQGTAGLSPPAGSNATIPATSARLNLGQAGLAMADDGTLFVTDTSNGRILSVSPEGALSVFAGTGTRGFLDNVPASLARLGSVRGIALDADGNVYFSEVETPNGGRIRRVGLDGVVATISGGAVDTPGHGDGGSGSGASFSDPRAIALGPDGVLYVVDAGYNNIRRIELTAPFLTTSVVNAEYCTSGAGLRVNDLGNTGLAWDAQGRMYFFGTLYDNGGCPVPGMSYQTVLLRLEANGQLTYIAGGPDNDANRLDAQPATQLGLADCSGLAIDGTGAVIFAESSRHRLRRLPDVATVVAGTTTGSTGTVSTLIGENNVGGFSSLTLPGSGRTTSPRGLLRDPNNGDLYWTEDTTSSVRLFIP
jgi:sugar lactone lactonase YvrE